MTHVIAIGGAPVVALVAAIYALRGDRDLTVSLSVAAGGAEEAEAFRPQRLPREMQALVDPLILHEWGRYRIMDADEWREFVEPLVMVDPLQCRIELGEFTNRLEFVGRPATGRSANEAEAAMPARILQARFAEGLSAPILFARECEEPHRYLQCFPCGGGMTIVRERRLPDAATPLEACFACEAALLAACAAIDARPKTHDHIEIATGGDLVR